MFQIPVTITVCILGSIDTESVVAVKGEGDTSRPYLSRGHWIPPQAQLSSFFYLDTLLAYSQEPVRRSVGLKSLASAAASPPPPPDRRLLMSDLVRGVSWSPPADAASAIIRGGARRRREVYYPFSQTWAPQVLRLFSPSLLDAVMRTTMVMPGSSDTPTAQAKLP